MAFARRAGLGFFAATLLSASLLGGCGGGVNNPRSDLLSGVASAGAPLAGAAVQLHCADGSVFNSSTNDFGIWQVVLTTQPLPCALQASGGKVNGLTNSTAYHSVALAIGINNITPLTDLVLARALGASPQSWFDHPVFAGITANAVQSAIDALSGALGMRGALRQANPLTAAFIPDPRDNLFAALVAMDYTLADPAVDKTYAQLLDAAAVGTLETAFATFGPVFGAVYLQIFPY